MEEEESPTGGGAASADVALHRDFRDLPPEAKLRLAIRAGLGSSSSSDVEQLTMRIAFLENSDLIDKHGFRQFESLYGQGTDGGIGAVANMNITVRYNNSSKPDVFELSSDEPIADLKEKILVDHPQYAEPGVSILFFLGNGPCLEEHKSSGHYSLADGDMLDAFVLKEMPPADEITVIVRDNTGGNETKTFIFPWNPTAKVSRLETKIRRKFPGRDNFTLRMGEQDLLECSDHTLSQCGIVRHCILDMFTKDDPVQWPVCKCSSSSEEEDVSSDDGSVEDGSSAMNEDDDSVSSDDSGDEGDRPNVWNYDADYDLQGCYRQLDAQVKTLVEVDRATILDGTEESLPGEPNTISNAMVESYNISRLDECQVLPTFVKEVLMKRRLVSNHHSLTENEKSLGVMVLDSKHPSSKSQCPGTNSTASIPRLARLFYEWVHNFDKNLQRMYETYCITGSDIPGWLAEDMQLELCHDHHNYEFVEGRDLSGRDCNPLKTYFASPKVNKSSMACAIFPWMECRCNVRCDLRTFLLVESKFIEEVKTRLRSPFGLKFDGNSNEEFSEKFIIRSEHTFLLGKYDEAIIRAGLPSPEWIKAERNDPSIDQYLGIIPAVRIGVYRDWHNRGRIDLSILERHIFTTRPDHQRIPNFHENISEQCRLIKSFGENENVGDICSIVEGTSRSDLHNQPRVFDLRSSTDKKKPGTPTSVEKFNSNLLKYLSHLAEFDVYALKGQVVTNDPRLSIDEIKVGAWSLGVNTLDKDGLQRVVLKVDDSRNTLCSHVLMKYYQLYYECFDQNLILMYNFMKMQGHNITGKAAAESFFECCHNHHGPTRDMNPRAILLRDHRYNQSQYFCSNFPWEECRCLVRCHRRLHQLSTLRFESIMIMWSATHLISSPVPLRLPNETCCPVLTENDVRKRLAVRLRDAFLRADETVPAWITSQISNQGQLSITRFTCGHPGCNRVYYSEELVQLCNDKHLAEANEQSSRPVLIQFNTMADIRNNTAAQEKIRRYVEAWGAGDLTHIAHQMKLMENYSFNGKCLKNYIRTDTDYHETYKIGTKYVD